jgi:hypothetical protein
MRAFENQYTDKDGSAMLDLRLEQAAKAMAVLIGGSYAVGMMVSNGYLASFGISDFDVLRPKAVLSGLWFVLLFAAAIVAEDSIQYAFKMKEIPAGWKAGNALFAFVGVFLFYFMLLMTIRILLSRTGPNPLVALRQIASASLFMFLSAATSLTEMQNAWKEWVRRRADTRVGPTSAVFFIFHCSWAIFALFLFGVLFTTDVYRYVPEQYGGGKLRSVRIAVTDEGAKSLNRISIATPNNVVEGSTDLIHSTSESIAFRVNAGKAVILRRDEILTMRIE